MNVALILAAGAGSRIGTPKANVKVNGERLIDHAVTIFKAGGCADVYVVLGAWVGEVAGAKVIINDDWQDGMGSSLRAGLSHISTELDIENVLISLVDLPNLTTSAVEQILLAPGEIVVGTFNGAPGHPVKFSRQHWQGVIDSAIGEVGARAYLTTRLDVHFLSLDAWADGRDIDTFADWELSGKE